MAFVGGAGVADWWAGPMHGKPMWRDMMARIEGPIVSDIQGVVAENWLECCGEILTGPETYKPHTPADGAAAFAIKSSPSDRATASRVLFQTLVEGATKRVLISHAVFPARQGVSPGDPPHRVARRRDHRHRPRCRDTDQRWVRLASRRMYGQMLECGVRIFEYRPGMTHVKALLVDDLWAVIGTTNVDNRSFEHNDEVNVAIPRPATSPRGSRADLLRGPRSGASEITLDAWRRRPLWEKLIGTRRVDPRAAAMIF